jgi:hypothetical protein
MDQRLFRALYALEFLLSLVAIYTVWGQVGGQGHLDQMDWRWKLVLGIGTAVAIVKATGAAVTGERTWNARSLRWLSVIIAFSAAAVFITYYYHLYEPIEEEEESVAEEEQPMIYRMAGRRLLHSGNNVHIQTGERPAHPQLSQPTGQFHHQPAIAGRAAAPGVRSARHTNPQARQPHMRTRRRPAHFIRSPNRG